MNTDGPMTRWLDSLLRTPPLPALPQESGVQVVQPAPAFLRYRLCYWAVGHIGLLAIVLVVFGGPLIGFLVAGSGALQQLPKFFDGNFRNVPGMAKFFVYGVVGLILFSIVLSVIGAILRTILGWWLVQLDARRRWYILGERTLTIREGITAVREMTFTYANIQDVRLTAGPLSRFFGIGHITVETAGGGAGAVNQEHKKPAVQMHKATLAGLGNASAIRDALLERQRRCRNVGLGDELPALPQPAPAQAEVLRDLLSEASALRVAAERLRLG